MPTIHEKCHELSRRQADAYTRGDRAALAEIEPLLAAALDERSRVDAAEDAAGAPRAAEQPPPLWPSILAERAERHGLATPAGKSTSANGPGFWSGIVQAANARRCGPRREPEPAEQSSAAAAGISASTFWDQARDDAAARRGR